MVFPEDEYVHHTDMFCHTMQYFIYQYKELNKALYTAAEYSIDKYITVLVSKYRTVII